MSFTPVGTPYRNLLDDLIAAPALKPFGLEAAEKLAPEAEGGLNIEGLAAAPDRHAPDRLPEPGSRTGRPSSSR